MTDPFLERALVGPLPDFQARWRELRRTYPPDSPPGTKELLAHVVAHVQHALEVGRVAEVTRFFLAVERLLGEADPVLAEMLEEQLLGTLARECRESAVAPERVLPHLGPRARGVGQARPMRRGTAPGRCRAVRRSSRRAATARCEPCRHVSSDRRDARRES